MRVLLGYVMQGVSTGFYTYGCLELSLATVFQIIFFLDTILIRFTDTTGVFFISGDTVLIRFRDGVEYDLI